MDWAKTTTRRNEKHLSRANDQDAGYLTRWCFNTWWCNETFWKRVWTTFTSVMAISFAVIVYMCCSVFNTLNQPKNCISNREMMLVVQDGCLGDHNQSIWSFINLDTFDQFGLTLHYFIIYYLNIPRMAWDKDEWLWLKVNSQDYSILVKWTCDSFYYLYQNRRRIAPIRTRYEVF